LTAWGRLPDPGQVRPRLQRDLGRQGPALRGRPDGQGRGRDRWHVL